MHPNHVFHCLSVFATVMGFASTAFAHDGARLSLPQPPRLAQVEAAPAAQPRQESCALTLRIVDATTGKSVPGLIHIANAAGQTIRPAELLPRATAFTADSLGAAAHAYMDRWFMLPGPRTVVLPRGTLTLSAFRGIESKMAVVTLDLSARTEAELAIPLEPVAGPWTGRDVSGNVHLHLQKMTLPEAERYATEVAMGDGLGAVFLSYLERAGADTHYISNTFTAPDLERFREQSGVLFGYGEEYRHNFTGPPGSEGYGHVMFLDLPELILPASLGPNITKAGNDVTVLRPGIERARAREATVLWCHNAFGHEDIPSWVAGLIDGQIIFDGGAMGDYESGFYRYLNIGLRVPVSMGTDWFYNDMAMTMARLEGALTTQAWLASLRAGRSYITNGPLLDFAVDGARAGERVTLAGPGTVTVHARAAGRNDFLGLELVANGQVIAQAATRPGGGIFEAGLEVSVPVAASTWLAVRATPFHATYNRPEAVAAGFNEYGKPLFAHTSPVYVEVGGQGVLIPEAAESLIAELHSSMVSIRHTGKYGDDAERDSVLAIYASAQAALRAMLDR